MSAHQWLEILHRLLADAWNNYLDEAGFDPEEILMQINVTKLQPIEPRKP
jgi:hypothetical protein